MDNIGKLKIAIKDKGYTQEQFAELLGISRNSLMRRLRKETEFKLLEKNLIKKLFNIEL